MAEKRIRRYWQKVSEAKPPRHQGVWHVHREGIGFFYATVCYGLHEPWWVPQNNAAGIQSDPIDMQDDDIWQAPMDANEIRRELDKSDEEIDREMEMYS